MTDTAAELAVVEQAKGVLMLRYGVGSYESLAAMARWAHEAQATLHEVAHALVKGVCQGRVTAESQGMVRWLEQRLRGEIGEAPRAAAEGVAASRAGRRQPGGPGPALTGDGGRQGAGAAVALLLGRARGTQHRPGLSGRVRPPLSRPGGDVPHATAFRP